MTHPAIYIIFIGGAADKESFLWGNINLPFVDIWPHNLIGQLREGFQRELEKKTLNEKLPTSMIERYCKIDYLSYTEVFFEELKSYDPNQSQLIYFTDEKLETLTNNIAKETKVYIIGHSLGGWNAAHLSCILSKLGACVEYLVTLDPVGTGNHEVSLFSPLMKKAQIYIDEPVPIAQNWINIQARHLHVEQKQTTGLLEDWVAWAGGQWLIERQYPSVDKQTFEVTNFSHKEALEMFTYPTKLGYSAYDEVQSSIIKNIKRLKWRRYNPLYWLKK